METFKSIKGGTLLKEFLVQPGQNARRNGCGVIYSSRRRDDKREAKQHETKSSHCTPACCCSPFKLYKPPLPLVRKRPRQIASRKKIPKSCILKLYGNPFLALKHTLLSYQAVLGLLINWVSKIEVLFRGIEFFTFHLSWFIFGHKFTSRT